MNNNSVEKGQVANWSKVTLHASQCPANANANANALVHKRGLSWWGERTELNVLHSFRLKQLDV